MNALLDLIRRHKSGAPVGIYSVCSAHPLVLEAALSLAFLGLPAYGAGAALYAAKLSGAPLTSTAVVELTRQLGASKADAPLPGCRSI